MLPSGMFRDRALAERLVRSLHLLARRLPGVVRIMEVCGTHTMAIARYGIRAMLPENVQLLSGPGCPVCVTAPGYIDAAIALGEKHGAVIATFGDMVRVPGTGGRSISEVSPHVCYSPTDALELAASTDRRVVFLAIGFETTAPTVAATVLAAERRGLENFSLLVSHKTIPPAMSALLASGKTRISAFLCPGHVSTIIGSKPYETVAREFGTPCVVAGFEPIDILHAIEMILRQLLDGRAGVEIQYRRIVRPEGNPEAVRVMYEAYCGCDADWRGIGVIPASGLRLRDELRRFDAEAVFGVEVGRGRPDRRCICGLIMQGMKLPPDCRLFGGECRPESPVGPCMVSSEGACAAYYKYRPL